MSEYGSVDEQLSALLDELGVVTSDELVDVNEIAQRTNQIVGEDPNANVDSLLDALLNALSEADSQMQPNQSYELRSSLRRSVNLSPIADQLDMIRPLLDIEDLPELPDLPDEDNVDPEELERLLQELGSDEVPQGGGDQPWQNITDDDIEQELNDAGIQEYVQGARTWLASTTPQEFAQWVDTQPDDDKNILLAEQDLLDAYQLGQVPAPQDQPPPVPPQDVPAPPQQVFDVVSASAAAVDVNKQNCDDTNDGGYANYMVGGGLLLIGLGHDENALSWVTNSPDYVMGSMRLKKAPTIGRGYGSMTFQGVANGAQQALITQEVARFSRKEVRFG